MNKKIVTLTLLLGICLPIYGVFAKGNDLGIQNLQTVQTQQAKKDLETEKAALESQREKDKKMLLEEKQAKKLEFLDSKEKMAQEKCKDIENRINNRINTYENHEKTFQNIYDSLLARLERLRLKLKEAGSDTGKLEGDLTILKTKVDALKYDQSFLIKILKESQVFACTKSEGDFKTEIEGARKGSAMLKNDREDIKTFLQKVVRVDLQEIRNILAVQEQETTSLVPTPEPGTIQ